MKRESDIKEDEIDVLELIHFFWSQRLLIIKITSVFVVIGLVIALTAKIEYEASCKLMPESYEGMNGSLGGLSGLAGLAGINLNASSHGSLTPDLYPEIVESTPFQLDLINEPLYFTKLDSVISSYSYFKEIDKPSLVGLLKSYTIGLPNKLKTLFSEENDTSIDTQDQKEIIKLSKDDWGLLESFRDRMEISVEPSGVILISVKMPDSYAAANIVDILVKKLTAEITIYKIEKVKTNLEFILERYNESEKEYKEKQKEVAVYADRNKNITSSLVQTEYQRLQNELDISFEVYKGLAAQLEQARIKVKEETPVFTVLEPVRVPVDKSEPRRKLILIISLFIGLVTSTTFSFLKRSVINIK